jgi:eight-cysteine-cluster-containing protein
MHTKKLVVGAVSFLVLMLIFLGVSQLNRASENGEPTLVELNDQPIGEQESEVSETERRTLPPEDTEIPVEKIKADVFTGTLETVDTGCFADGECFAVVDGKHVTALMGWSRDAVGAVLGVDGFGDLENYIGNEVEVYAQEKDDGTYTLYGSDGFYIKVENSKGSAPASYEPVAASGCIVGGCSGQLCTGASEGDIATTCEYRAEYACYQRATCERQVTGKCGWTDTQELRACLSAGGYDAI